MLKQENSQSQSDYLAGLTDGQNVFTIVVSDDAAYNVTFVVTTTGGPDRRTGSYRRA